jgi:uncharacterized protein (TIGR00266 family)
MPMKIDVRYQPSYSLAIVQLKPGEAIQAESGAMVSMSGNIQPETSMKGGVFGAVKRKVLGGESLFSNTYRAQGGPGEVTLAPSLPGDITHVPLRNETLFIQSASFLAGDPALDLDTTWGGARTFFSGEGLFLLKASGSGDLLVSSYGAIHKVPIGSGQRYICDTGHIVAFTEGLSFDVRKFGSWKSTFLGGEGLVCEFQGQGSLYMQTRSTQAFLSWLIPQLPTATGGGGTSGAGILGRVLRGQ